MGGTLRLDWRLVAIALLGPPSLLVVARLDLESGRAWALLAGCLAFIAVEATIALRTRASSRRRAEAGLTLLSGFFCFVGIVHGRIGGPGVFPESPGLVLVPLLVLLAGVALRVLALLELGRWFVPAVSIEEGQRLVRRGPYALARHPGYVGYWLSVLGLGGLGGSLVAAAGALACATAWVRARVRDEEAALELAFGDEWRAYAARTGRYVTWPSFGGVVVRLRAAARSR